MTQPAKVTQTTQQTPSTQQTQPTISVIICCYTMERLNDIKEAVDSVLNQTLKPYEVILSVDHNEELFRKLVETYRDSIEIRRKFPNLNESQPISIKLVLNTGAQGLSETRNVGIHAATGDIVAFIDDDAIAEPDWLETLTNLFLSPAPSPQSQVVVAVGGRAIPLWIDGKRPTWFPEELDWIVGCTYKGLPVNYSLQSLVTGQQSSSPLDSGLSTHDSRLLTIRNVPGCNMAFRKEIFEQVGLFRSEMGGIKETPRGGEEADLCLRIKHKIPDSLILYEPAAIIHHKVPSWRLSLKYLGQRSFNEGFYKAKVQKLHQRTLSTQQTQRTPQTQKTQKTLSTERSYLRYLLLTSIPERLKHIYKKGSLPQAVTIIISIVATGAGYFIGKIKTWNLEL